MPRHRIPIGFSQVSIQSGSPGAPTFQLKNEQGHKLSVNVVNDGLVRVAHELPPEYPQRFTSGIQWEETAAQAQDTVDVKSKAENASTIATKSIRIEVDWSNGCPRLRWFSTIPNLESPTEAPFLSDCRTRAYTFDATAGGVLHYVEREDWLPVSEHEPSPAMPLGPHDKPFVHDRRNEFVYGLGEVRGGVLRNNRRFTLEARDGAGYDLENGDPLYKVTPFYVVFNKRTGIWCGVYYNSLANDASIDFGAECDALFDGFRTYRAGCGPLDYYVILGDGTLPSIVSIYASLTSPSFSTQSSPASNESKWRASSTLPPLSQFGYLASSLALAEEPHAQNAVLDFVKTCRAKGFPIDALHLSSGWCQHPETDNRHYFVWNRNRYPDPRALGTALENDMNVRIIANIKAWLLDDHPLYDEALKMKAYVHSASIGGDHSKIVPAKSILWAGPPGTHMYGTYLDFSAKGGAEWWSQHIKKDLIGMNVTGMWIDNNEYSGLVDDDEGYAGENSFWGGGDWERRSGWGGGKTTVGRAGRLIQMMGMARTTYDTMLGAFPDRRPVIVTRAAVPGMQAYAHGTWSGDNSTTSPSSQSRAPDSVVPTGGMAHQVHCSQLEGHFNHIMDLLPTMYSLYVSQYWKKGWPVLRPMFWHHSSDPRMLTLDEQFLFGSHILVAPVLAFGDRKKRVYLPNSVVGSKETPEWCELDTGRWHTGTPEGFLDLDAPITRTPALVRAGGILVLGNKCANTVYDGNTLRVAHIFPSLAPQNAGATGSFTLIEDDGKTNAHVDQGVYTEVEVTFQVQDKGCVEVDVKVLHNAYELLYDVIWFVLPIGDNREMKAKGNVKSETKTGEDGRIMLGVYFKS
ncbi:glycoside hydrolase family 31 protein [Ceratobasidium sp. AG-Ba]|nr:glycoside hydrolase family 31 protein [Ceratobasidium sp. AG-Ba]QRW06653.1 glycoside hydrolase family 31 protein [Ceratobasidium sp. AG-Ba]